MSNIIPLRNTGGFTRMDNDLYEALIGADLSGRELRVALAIHRYTAGYNVETARIPAVNIAKMSGIARENVSRIIGELIRQRVIYRDGGSKAPIGISPSAEWKIDLKNEDKNTKSKATQSVISDTSLVLFPTHIKDSKDNLGSNEPVAAVASTGEVISAGAQDQQLAKPSADRIPYAKIVELYNRVCGHILPNCQKLTDKRRAAIKRAWHLSFAGGFPFRGNADFWEGYFNDCLTNPHWTGANDRQWKADLEFLLREDKILKVLEAQ